MTDPVEIPLADEILVLTPNLFSFWLLRLFALSDRVESEDRDNARRHAYDLYALWASTDEEEWEDAPGADHIHLGQVMEA